MKVCCLTCGVHGHVEGEEVWGEGLVVGIKLLHFPHHLVLICLRQELHVALAHHVAEVW